MKLRKLTQASEIGGGLAFAAFYGLVFLHLNEFNLLESKRPTTPFVLRAAYLLSPLFLFLLFYYAPGEMLRRRWQRFFASAALTVVFGAVLLFGLKCLYFHRHHFSSETSHSSELFVLLPFLGAFGAAAAIFFWSAVQMIVIPLKRRYYFY